MKPGGVHHESCLDSPERTAPERLRTVIRQPASAATGIRSVIST
ncbi:hypothetical protein [Streptomyces sp. NPDC001020]